jgi:uncharacterized protein YoxC
VTILALILFAVALVAIVVVNFRTHRYLKRRAEVLDKRHKTMSRDALRTQKHTEELLTETRELQRFTAGLLADPRVQRILKRQ